MTAPPSNTPAAPPRGTAGELAARLRALEHAMRTPVGTLSASLELLRTEQDRQSTERVLQTMERQVGVLTAQLEQLHDVGLGLAAQAKDLP